MNRQTTISSFFAKTFAQKWQQAKPYIIEEYIMEVTAYQIPRLSVIISIFNELVIKLMPIKAICYTEFRKLAFRVLALRRWKMEECNFPENAAQ